jgi:hypothetical protein
MQADYQSARFLGQDWLCDFSRLPLAEKTGRGATVQGFALSGR